jgi:predicted PurR-regulated permease PerM
MEHPVAPPAVSGGARRTRVSGRHARRDIPAAVLAVLAVIYLLQWAQEVFVPLVLGVLLSYALEPVVAWLVRRRVPRVIASAAVVTALAGGSVYTAYALSDDAAAILDQAPEAVARLGSEMRELRRANGSTVRKVERAAEELQRVAEETGVPPASPPPGVTPVQVVSPALDIREYLFWGSASLAAFAGQGALVVFFVFFLLVSGSLFKRKLVKLAGPSLEGRKAMVQVLDDINAKIERYLFAHVLAAVVVGVVSWLAFRLVGLEQAAVWGIAAGIFNTIPYFGPLLVAAGATVVALLQFDTIGAALGIGALSLGITSVEGWLLMPWLTSRAARINEVAVFVGLILWGFLWGVWGTLLAVPILVVIKACCDRLDGLRPVGELLGD